jgi:hypothetical protein
MHLQKPDSLKAAEMALVRLSEQLSGEDSNWSQPFLAGVGPRYFEATPRLLIVGKATKGWSDVENQSDPESIAASAASFMTGPTSGLFFGYIRKLAEELCIQPPGHRGLDAIAWSNLARMDYAEGNPKLRNFKKQRDVALELMQEEVAWLQPDLIVVLTSDYEPEFVREAFGFGGREILPDAGHTDCFAEVVGGVPIAWVRHPQGKAADVCATERRAIKAFYQKSRQIHS